MLQPKQGVCRTGTEAGIAVENTLSERQELPGGGPRLWKERSERGRKNASRVRKLPRGRDLCWSNGSRLGMAGGQAAGEEADHGPVERRQVGGLPAAHPVAVLDHLAIHPVAARVAD